MARPLKDGLDYFSHDTDMRNDFKMKLLKAKFGLIGYAVYNILLEDIYKDSYYLKIDEDYLLLFSAENNIDESGLKEIITFMAEKELFSLELYTKYSILTSARIQKNYIHGNLKRSKISFNSAYILINATDYTAKINLEVVKGTETIVKVESSTHNIVKDSIVKDSIEEENKNSSPEGKNPNPKNSSLTETKIITAWNDFAIKNSLSQIKTITKSRKRKLETRFLESDFELDKILETAGMQKFLKGDNQRGWRMDFDFIIENDTNYIKILEGKYNNGHSAEENPGWKKAVDHK